MGDWLNALLDHSPYLIAVMGGLMGSFLHCPAMCGGIVSAFSLGRVRVAARPNQPALLNHPVAIQLGYNLGRMTSYALAGALAGGLGALSLFWADAAQTRHILQGMQYLSALLMILLGLYLANIWRSGINRLEQAGRGLWRRIEPLGRRFMPVNNALRALPFGMVWGWLPCGLVYTFLVMSLNTGSALGGAMMMLSFGLGTLPGLLLMGILAQRLLHAMRRPQLRVAGGVLAILLGVLMALRVWLESH
ncbi:MAG: sulfite exporter TauE/SafE family protein [Thiolinea sp.]